MTPETSKSNRENLLNDHNLPKRLLTSRELDTTKNTLADLQTNLTSPGVTITRFPPEPNGYLHLGHAKALNFNFLLSGKKSKYDGTTQTEFEKLYTGERPPGKCYLRFDDSNPLTCNLEFKQNIQSSIEWLGFSPSEITSASQYFPDIYNFALQLINQGDAFVCFLSREDSKKNRESKLPSPYRETSISENLKLFAQMSSGCFKEEEAVLRIKIDPSSPNPSLRDPPIYRVCFTPHPFINPKKYPHKVFPLYDFTHCICDSLEKITISCCSLEFEIRRDLYYTILDKLKIYRPWVFEYSRLNLEGALTSKRKIKKLVSDKIVEGWNDPRLYTLDGLKRRGVPAWVINKFVRSVGITRRDNTEISKEKFESVLRTELDLISRRGFCVIKKDCKVLVLDSNKNYEFNCPDFPNLEGNEEKHLVKFNKFVLINSNDFMENGNKKYFGLTSNKEKKIRLKYSLNVSFLEFNKNEKFFENLKKENNLEGLKNEQIIKVKVYENDERLKKGNITFVGDEDLRNKVTVRIFKYNSEKMEKDEEEGFVTRNIIDKIGEGEKWFQFERMGFFYLDESSEIVKREGRVNVERSKIVFNNVVDLKVNKERVKILKGLKK